MDGWIDEWVERSPARPRRLTTRLSISCMTCCASPLSTGPIPSSRIACGSKKASRNGIDIGCPSVQVEIERLDDSMVCPTRKTAVANSLRMRASRLELYLDESRRRGGGEHTIELRIKAR